MHSDDTGPADDTGSADDTSLHGAVDGADAVARVFAALHPTASIDGSTARARYRPEPEHRGNPGWLHGGLAATLLDHICARAASATLGTRVVTGTLDLRYRHPVPLDGGPFVLEATAAAPRHRTVRVVGALIDRQGVRLVEATALFVSLPAAMIERSVGAVS